MKPIISSITPCYRMKKYLKGFLNDLPKQTIFDRMEIVLDHNEPEEEELEWVKGFQSKYPGVLKHIVVNPVDPIGVSMNRCIREASADIVAIWNVDDLRVPDSLERQAALLINNPDVGIANGNFVVVRSFGTTSGTLVRHDHYPREEYFRSMILGPFFAFRKELCEQVGYFDEQLLSGADFDLAIRLAIHSKIACVDGFLGFYLDEGLGASTRPNSKQPIERTVIELRYGIYDKIESQYLEEAKKYDIENIKLFNEWHNIKNFVPDYDDFIKNNGPKYFWVKK